MTRKAVFVQRLASDSCGDERNGLHNHTVKLTKQSFSNMCVPKLEFGNEVPYSSNTRSPRILGLPEYKVALSELKVDRRRCLKQVFAPIGAATNQPRATPRVITVDSVSPERAKHRCGVDQIFVSPIQG